MLQGEPQSRQSRVPLCWRTTSAPVSGFTGRLASRLFLAEASAANDEEAALADADADPAVRSCGKEGCVLVTGHPGSCCAPASKPPAA